MNRLTLRALSHRSSAPTGGRDLFRLPRRSATLVLLVGLFLASPMLAIRSEGAEPTRSWRHESSRDGIEVWTRPVSGSTARAFRGEGVMPVATEEIVELLSSADRFKTWFPETLESSGVEVDSDTLLHYSVLDMPWPVADRDNVLKSTLKRDDKTGVVEIFLEAAPKGMPNVPGLVRVHRASGYWRLEPRGANTTFVRFDMHLDPGGKLPEPLVNARITATPYQALSNLRQVLATSIAE